MDVCYIDESGSCELLDPNQPASTPVLVVAGLIVPAAALKSLAWEFLRLKEGFNPSLSSGLLSDLIKHEVKGSNLRADIRSSSRNRRRRAFGILDKLFTLLDKHGCRVVARVVVKDTNVALDDRTMYGSAIGWICTAFHQYLEEADTQGIVVLDSRTKVKNTPNSDRITTQKFKTGGDPLERLVEVPVFGHSDSHINLQIIDLLASAILFPAACSAYCLQHSWNTHACQEVRRCTNALWRSATGAAVSVCLASGPLAWRRLCHRFNGRASTRPDASARPIAATAGSRPSRRLNMRCAHFDQPQPALSNGAVSLVPAAYGHLDAPDRERARSINEVLWFVHG